MHIKFTSSCTLGSFLRLYLRESISLAYHVQLEKNMTLGLILYMDHS